MAKRYYNLEKETKEYLKACEAKGIANQTNIKTLNDYVISRKSFNRGCNFLKDNLVYTDNLVLWLDANISESYTGGSTIYDLSNSLYDFTVLNSPLLVKQSLNSFISLNGTDQYILRDTFPFSFRSNSFTVSYFTRIKQSKSNQGMIYSSVNGPFNTNGVGLEIRYSTLQIQSTISDGTGNGIRTIFDNSFTVDQWRNFVFKFDRSNLIGYHYINGLLVAQQSYAGETSNVASYRMWVGRGWDGYMNADISNVLVYNGSLSDNQILQNYNALKGRFGL